MILRLIYSAFFTLALPFIFLRLYVRGRRAPAYRQRWKERLGYCSFTLKNSIWVHSVSMGETIAIAPLVKKLIDHYPDTPFVITTMTPTGSDEVARQYHTYHNVYHCYLPYDLGWCLRRFMRRIRPEACVIMETELWPNMLHTANQFGIKVILTNARLSEKSARGYGRIGSVTRMMLEPVRAIATQTQTDTQRFINLGYPAERCHTSGNLKYDLNIDEQIRDDARSFRAAARYKRIWIAASTHNGEESMALAAHQQILQNEPEAMLIIVPRHPERFQEVQPLARPYQFTTARRSTATGLQPDCQVFIGDSMGELMFYYALADVAFVGGSLVEHGGHNMLEPAALGIPVLSGPYVFNFAEIARKLEQAGGLSTVNNSTELAETVSALFADRERCEKQGKQARALVQHNQGALQRQFDTITSIIREQ